MIVTIKQVTAGLENRFEITESGRLLYHAQTPWLAVSAPFQAENLRRLVMTEENGDAVFTTAYHLLENTLEQAIPFRYLFTGQQRFCQYEIIGREGTVGAFYTRQDGLMDKKYCLEAGGRELLGYDISRGKFAVVSIYDGEEQIAQITKPLAVVGNLDVYYLHIAEGFEDLLPLLAFFTIYYDYRKYPRSGQLSARSAEISLEWTWNKNNRFYQPNWIADRFGQEEADRLAQKIGVQRETAGNEVKRRAKIVGLCFLIGIPAILLLLWLLVWR